MAETVQNICFHGIGTPGRELEPGEEKYWVSADLFHRVLDEVRTWPAVRISFDDGNASDVEIGLPGLVERGLTADFFVLGGRLDHPGSLSRDDVRVLRANGMVVGSHGMRHRSWRGMSGDQVREELVEARDRIADASGAPVQTVACPFGLYDRGVLMKLREHGYTGVFTSDRAPARSGAWLQPRFSVVKDDTVASVRMAVKRGSAPRQRVRSVAVGLVKRWR
jgi:peptidoglycan/xylan/chitin deacetylase (PgdA/CDA1 family)